MTDKKKLSVLTREQFYVLCEHIKAIPEGTPPKPYKTWAAHFSKELEIGEVSNAAVREAMTLVKRNDLHTLSGPARATLRNIQRHRVAALEERFGKLEERLERLEGRIQHSGTLFSTKLANGR